MVRVLAAPVCPMQRFGGMLLSAAVQRLGWERGESWVARVPIQHLGQRGSHFSVQRELPVRPERLGNG